MDKITEAHRKAMSLLGVAFSEKAKGNQKKASELFLMALEREKEAASLVFNKYELEPTRSILYRSAASIALQCNELREAEKLIAHALSGNPPDEIAEELRDLLEQVNFKRHLDTRGMILGPDDFHFSISGEEVGKGLANSAQFIERIKNVRTLFYRTTERMFKIPFDESRSKKSKMWKEYELYIAVPVPGSFAVSFRVGYIDQPKIPQIDEGPRIIDEFIDCLDLYSKNSDKLLQKIEDPAYYRNFVGLANKIAPDGRKVKLVGLVSFREGKKTEVVLQKSRKEYVLPEPEVIEKKIIQKEVRGILDFADATEEDKGQIKVTDETGKHHPILVPAGLMDDIVRPMWREEVIVSGNLTEKGAIRLKDIKRVEEE